MTASQIANWLALAALAFAVFSASVGFALGLGRVLQRVGDLRDDCDKLINDGEQDGKGHLSRAIEFARFEERISGEIKGIHSQIAAVDGRLSELAKNIALAQPPGYIMRGRPRREGTTR